MPRLPTPVFQREENTAGLTSCPGQQRQSAPSRRRLLPQPRARQSGRVRPLERSQVASAGLARCRAASPAQAHAGPGEVYLVGTGPGDPELLTLKAVRLMRQADVVLYDRLVSTDILDLVSDSARMVYVGKQRGLHTRTQDEIHALLQRFADDGLTVLRLKGGDPFIYGRGGEEALYLRQRGIAVHVVPGITAAAGICAELGIPLTHRGVATSVRFLTGHAQEGGAEELGAQVAQAADAHTTLVVYMGLGLLGELVAALRGAGLAADTPAAAVERGTTAAQRTVLARLEDLPARVAATGLRSPTLLVFGAVVALSPEWPRTEERSREGAGAEQAVLC